MKKLLFELRLWYKLNHDNVNTILAGIGISVCIAGMFMLAKMCAP